MEPKKKRRWVGDLLKFAACAVLIGVAWWLWQRNLGPELREALSPKPRAAAQEIETSDAR